MFQSNKQPATTHHQGTIIGDEVVLTGTLRDKGPITIFGKAKGDITSDQSVHIGETAKIDGPITAPKITIAGTVKGEITAPQSLEISSGGELLGSIKTKNLTIHSGASFNGDCAMEADLGKPNIAEPEPAELSETRRSQPGQPPPSAEEEDEDLDKPPVFKPVTTKVPPPDVEPEDKPKDKLADYYEIED